MIDRWLIILVALAYIGFLFGVASYGDRRARLRGRAAGGEHRPKRTGRPIIYALSLAVYCTSWTFFGSVGLSARSGLDFLPIYIGPILMLAIGWPLFMRVARIAKSQNITSIADFIAARYGKNQLLGAVVTIIAVAGTVPYLALQLKAVSESVSTLLGPAGLTFMGEEVMALGDTALFIALAMSAFAVLFGTRHIDATEHQDGLMLAIATESVIKLAAFLAVGAYVVYGIFGGPQDLYEQAQASPEVRELFSGQLNGSTWLTMIFLSLVVIMLLPRQFHVAIVENNSERDIRTASWLFPLYLVLINLFVVPIAVAGLLTFPQGDTSADMFVLALPLAAGSDFFSMLAFVGGLSAATAMVIVASVALSIMVCNNLIIPIILHGKTLATNSREDLGGLLLGIRRGAIIAVIMLGYGFYKMVGNSFPLASIGLLSFAAIAQFAPAFFGGLLWRNGTAAGALAGIVTGFLVWGYTLLLPYFVSAGWLSAEIMQQGLFGFGLLRPEQLFNLEFEPFTHGVIWSMLINLAAYILVSLWRAPKPIERLQANSFIPDEFTSPPAPALTLRRTSVSISDLKKTVIRYLGKERMERAFADYAANRGIALHGGQEADVATVRYTEHLLASAIGAASSRLVLSLLLRRRNVGRKSALELLDDATEAIQYNRDLLQSAIDKVGQGIAVFDKHMRLSCWNQEFRHMLNLPLDLTSVGVPLSKIVTFCASHGGLGQGATKDIVTDRINRLVVKRETFHADIGNGQVLEIRSNALPQGGIVVTYNDITERFEAARALEQANQSLEKRVRDRTTQLVQANRELALAKVKADEANLGKTRFLAAASHDVLQPLNAARLYASSLVEREAGSRNEGLASNLDASLEAVEEILTALLDISRLDAGAMKADISSFAMADLLQNLQVEFDPLAREKGLALHIVPTSLWVRSDRKLLRRVLQNLVSNAIKYTREGRILLGCRRRDGHLSIEVHDTGIGIPVAKQQKIFLEFERVNGVYKEAPGLGLGLSIVERITQMLKHPISVTSEPGRGSIFAVTLPLGRERIAESHPPQKLSVHNRHYAGCLVLCVDNEGTILEGMNALLTGWDCTTLLAHDLNESLEALHRQGRVPDLIVADYHLDDATGVEVVTALYEHLETEVPAVIITADHSPEVEAEVLARGLNILRKPIKPAALRALLSQIRLRQIAAE